MRGKRRRVELEPEVERAFEAIKANEPRGDEAIEGFIRFVSRAAEHGYAVPRTPGVLSRPLHTAVAAYLVIYEIDDEVVTCVGIRQVPYNNFS